MEEGMYIESNSKMYQMNKNNLQAILSLLSDKEINPLSRVTWLK